MSGSVNEEDGVRRSNGKTGEGFTEGAGEGGWKHGEVEKDGRMEGRRRRMGETPL